MVNRYAVVGSGYMGGGIAQVLALSGARVAVADVSGDIARNNLDRLLAESDSFVADGLFAPGSTDTLRKNLWAAESIEVAVADASFIVEAVPESINVKHKTLQRVSDAAPATAIIGSNTSTISIGELAAAVTLPGRFLGVHFANPAPFIPGVEIIPHAGTEDGVLTNTRRIISESGKQAATVKDVTGFVMNRLQYALFQEAATLVDEGVATVADIDTVVRTTFGFRLPLFGPFAVADMAGLDVYASCYEQLHGAFPERFDIPKVLENLVAAGQFGTKTGGGFFRVTVEQSAELIAYRNRAYVRLSQLMDELGPAPIS